LSAVQIVGQVLYLAVLAFIVLLWVRFIVDWVQVFARDWTPRGPLLVVLEVVYSVTDPPVLALRRLIPPLRIGGFALDLSFLLVLLAAYLLLNLIGSTLLAA
jgi:YggT family protein